MDLNINGNPGNGNSYSETKVEIHQDIKIGSVGQYINHAERVEYDFGKQKGTVEIEKPEDKIKEPEDNVDCFVARAEILNYVSRVRPLLTDEAKSDYMKVWEDILDLREVEALVYKPGKQKGTNFNRDLVANILYFLRNWKIYRVVYKQDYNGAALTEALEQDKEHSVKHALRDDPPHDIQDAITAMMKKKHQIYP